jgi:hypothetical protein
MHFSCMGRAKSVQLYWRNGQIWLQAQRRKISSAECDSQTVARRNAASINIKKVLRCGTRVCDR